MPCCATYLCLGSCVVGEFALKVYGVQVIIAGEDLKSEKTKVAEASATPVMYRSTR